MSSRAAPKPRKLTKAEQTTFRRAKQNPVTRLDKLDKQTIPKKAAVSAMKMSSYLERQAKKEAERRKQTSVARGQKKCGAKRRAGGFCRLAAGAGTDHYGIGRCKHHGGSTPASTKHAITKQAEFMGAPKDINPIDAIMWCIRLTAGEVEFCTEQMQMLEEEEWIEHTLIGKQLHLWAKERQIAVDRLAKFSKDAISLGIAERAVRVAEMYGHSIAKLVKGILDDLELNGAQLERAPHIVRKHLILLEGTVPVSDEERERPALLPARVQPPRPKIPT